jgi:hypothetical protein
LSVYLNDVRSGILSFKRGCSMKKNEIPGLEGLTPIGKLPPEKLVKKLEAMKDPDVEKVRKRLVSKKGLFGSEPYPYEGTEHSYGFIPPKKPGDPEMIDIQYAGDMESDSSLQNQRIKITLDRLRTADYPGEGLHQILFDFYAQNQVKDNTEQLHFNQTFQSQEGQEVGVIGYPIFIGLYVGNEGANFACTTVNVKNLDDEKILKLLDSDAFKAGLKLVETAQPAIAPLASFAVGVTKLFANRHENTTVQQFSMGLDFGDVSTRARLRQGSYIAVQLPKGKTWDWNEWVYKPKNGKIVSRTDNSTLIPYNYIVIGVSKYTA